jgi:hypothetical protein
MLKNPRQKEIRKHKCKRRRPEEAATALLLVDPTLSALSSDLSKLSSAGVDDMVRDSLKEREKALSAASVLVEFMRKTE